MLSELHKYILISYFEIESKYAKTNIGIWWIPLSNTLFILLLTLIFRQDSNISFNEFLLYVAFGYTLWLFIAETISEGGIILVTQRDLAIVNGLSIENLFIKNTITRLFSYLLNFPFLIIVLVLGSANVFISLLALPLFLIFIGVASLLLSYILGVISLLYPDFGKSLNLLNRFLFFGSPVFWYASEESAGLRSLLYEYNPVSYFLSLIRQIIGIEDFSFSRALISILLVMIMAIIAYLLNYYYKGILRNIN